MNWPVPPIRSNEPTPVAPVQRSRKTKRHDERDAEEQRREQQRRARQGTAYDVDPDPSAVTPDDDGHIDVVV
jgi:hypothetical protein